MKQQQQKSLKYPVIPMITSRCTENHQKANINRTLTSRGSYLGLKQ